MWQTHSQTIIPHGSGSLDLEVVYNKMLLCEELEKPVVHNVQRLDQGRKLVH